MAFRGLSPQQKASIGAAILLGAGGSALANIVTDRALRKGKLRSAWLWTALISAIGVALMVKGFED